MKQAAKPDEVRDELKDLIRQAHEVMREFKVTIKDACKVEARMIDSISTAVERIQSTNAEAELLEAMKIRLETLMVETSEQAIKESIGDFADMLRGLVRQSSKKIETFTNFMNETQRRAEGLCADIEAVLKETKRMQKYL